MDEITNTTEQMKQPGHALGFLLEQSTTEGAIYAMEKQGQREVVASQLLPADLNGGFAREYVRLGFTFGEVLDDDPLFMRATLPEGWRKEGSDHDMWSYVVDERGLRRVAVFYKAAFYDRGAHMNLINVGYELANAFIYGTEETFVLPENLTPEEVEQVRQCAIRYREDHQRHPDIYDEIDRAVQVLAVVQEATHG